jgi:hypothetical protein
VLSEREARILREIEEWSELCDPGFAELMGRLSRRQPKRRRRACRIMLALTLAASVLVLAWMTAMRGQPVSGEHSGDLDVGSGRAVAVDAAPPGAAARIPHGVTAAVSRGPSEWPIDRGALIGGPAATQCVDRCRPATAEVAPPAQPTATTSPPAPTVQQYLEQAFEQTHR